MKRRVMAWIVLILFVLLLVNLVFIHYQWGLSLVVYLVIALFFLFAMKKDKMENDSQEDDGRNDNQESNN